jgi:RNA polymerase sigma-70 factor (ECF subfamily)
MTTARATDYQTLDDVALVACIRAGDAVATRLVISRNNQRLFRAAWGILKDRAEAEEAVQDAYLKAFTALAGFRGDAALSTWLTRIAVNEALSRRRAAARRQRNLDDCGVASLETYREAFMRGSSTGQSPDEALSRRQMAGLLEGAIARLPDDFRLVFVLREVEQLSIAETALALGVQEATVKTRLHRAKKRLRGDLQADFAGALTGALTFAGADCAAMADRVLEALRR